MSVTTIEIEEDEIYEATSPTVMARIEGNAGTNITQASLTSIAAKVYQLPFVSTDTPTLDTTLTIANVIFDTLQTTTLDSRWTEDSTGYNFKYSVPASAFPDGNKTYLLEVVFTPTSGDVIRYCRKYHTIAVHAA